VVCPSSDEAATARVEELAQAVGARPLRMDPADHDAAVAAISHLPLVVSAALVEAVAGDAAAWTTGRPLAAGGWASMSRLARGDAEMGAGILATNADEVSARLRRFRDVLDAWARDLDEADANRLRKRLEFARAHLVDG
jgi:prephenate dehydrogenase